MFTIDPLHPLQSAVIEILGQKGEMSVAQLHAALNARKATNVSLQHVYRMLTQMEEQQIVVKVRGSVSLNLMWLSYLSFFTQRAMAETFRHLRMFQDFPSNEGERKTITADSFIALDTVWTHILVQLDTLLHEKRWYSYNSHAWWQLLKMDTDTSFYANLKAKGVTVLGVYGNDTPLDRLGVSLIQSDVFPTVIDPEPAFPKQGYILVVCGDYIVQSVLPDTLSRQLDFFFANTKGKASFDSSLFFDIIRMPAKCKITIWKDAKEAGQLREKIERSLKNVRLHG